MTESKCTQRARRFADALNRRPDAVDLTGMTAFAVLVSLAFAALCAVLILGVMAVRVDDTHRFVKLVVDTRRIRRHFAQPLDAQKDGGRGGKKPSDDEFWPEPL